MKKHNTGVEDTESIQYKFTRYLVTAVKRHKASYLKHRKKLENMEIPLELQDYHAMLQIEPDMLEEFPLLEKLESEGLKTGIREMKEREQYIFLARVLDDRSFEEQAREQGMSYKGVTAIYYRAVQKICRRIEEVEGERILGSC